MVEETKAGIDSSAIPRTGGAYMLVLVLRAPRKLAIGKLGEYDFPAGWYLYAGSALGGLRGRVSRHLRSEKILRWHIDYLGATGSVADVWWKTGVAREECAWAKRAILLPGASMPARRFGASDCRCETHLVHLPIEPGPEEKRFVTAESLRPDD